MKPRTPKTFSAAMTRVKAALTEQECARVVGRSASLIRKWADPDHESLPNIKQALALDLAYIERGCGQPPLITAYQKKLAKAIEEAPVQQGIDVVLGILSMQATVGDLSKSIVAAHHVDGPGGSAITPKERATILTLLETLTEQIKSIENAFSAGEDGER